MYQTRKESVHVIPIHGQNCFSSITRGCVTTVHLVLGINIAFGAVVRRGEAVISELWRGKLWCEVIGRRSGVVLSCCVFHTTGAQKMSSFSVSPNQIVTARCYFFL
jgi:hypothetical protein